MNIPITKNFNKLLLEMLENNERSSDFRIDIDAIKKFFEEKPEEQRIILAELKRESKNFPLPLQLIINNMF